MSINTIEEIIEDLRDGKMVIIMDDEDRENEGDLIMAASKVRPEDINFMAQYGRGLICLTLKNNLNISSYSTLFHSIPSFSVLRYLQHLRYNEA